MTVTLPVLVIITIVLFWKLKGAQWPGLVMGILLARSATPGSSLDQLLNQLPVLFQSIADSIASGIEKMG